MDGNTDDDDGGSGSAGRRKQGAGAARRDASKPRPDKGKKGEKPAEKAVRAASKGAKPVPRVVTPRSAASGEQVRKKDFVDQVAAASGARKPDVRNVVDAMLALMAERVGAGDELIVPPLGRVRMVKEKDNGKARIVILRVHIASGEDEGGNSPGDGAPLAEGED